ncbi:T-cell surface glycoprotein CD3 gamma chain-like [Solea solea]|uniref:T-cell surface glycoprotein CD3 gamma chain-like n=1 Tax=Solea solea TaxID=90069 RepID=UPI00272D1BB8|nr:T-cell surface glycoprotein CD3 gamma chain-like [Solea solea]XP_058490391.1 T-cell surface glycoprotein CD3 gamma chain-like [Solea solea]
MKCQLVLPLLLLWTLSGSKANGEITVTTVPGGIRVHCGEKTYISENQTSLELPYEDGNSGNYKCEKKDTDEPSPNEEIYVKFRTCDNCIEFDTGSIAGLVIGNVVATVAIGVAVYLVASLSGPVKAQKTGSGRQHNIVPNERNSRAPNDHYQRLKFKAGGQKDEYDVIKNRRGNSS